MTDLVVERVDLSCPEVFDQVLALCGTALGWALGDPNRDFFVWKHLENPFGVSPTWVTRAGGEMVGARLLLRWQVRQGDRTIDLVRAVDTATAPSHQGQGIFSKLTTAAVRELTAEGIAAIFNTPNDKSRPGYLKMGWEELGRIPVSAAPRSVRATIALARGGAASKWGEPVDIGSEPATAFADEEALAALLASTARSPGTQTVRTPTLLRWRFGLASLAYRVWPLGNQLTDGLVVFRLRQRAGLRELSIVEVLAPAGHRLAFTAWWGLAKRCHADVVTTSSDTRHLVHGLPRLPRRLGPVLTWRPLADGWVPNPAELSLSHADLELF